MKLIDAITTLKMIDEEMPYESPDGNIHVVPTQGPEHLESEYCWCEPELIQDSIDEDGCKAYLHKEIQ